MPISVIGTLTNSGPQTRQGIAHSTIIRSCNSHPLSIPVRVHPLNSGFTLIEILVVVFIIAISASVILLSFNPGLNDGLKTEVDRLSSLLSLARQESVLQSKEMALELNNRGYKFLIYKEKQWTSFDDSIFRARELDEDVRLDVTIEGEQIDFIDDGKEDAPRVYILSSGEMTPFEIEFQRAGSATSYLIKGEINGKISREKIE